MKKTLQFYKSSKVVVMLALFSLSFCSMNAYPTPSREDPDCIAATLTLPAGLPSTISCSEVDGFTAPDATYDNYQTGECENSGTIAAQIILLLDEGFIKVMYEGFDDFGNPLKIWKDIEVIYPMPEITEPTFPASITVTEAMTYTPGNITYTNNLTGVCGITGFIEPIDFSGYWDECSGGYITFTYADYLFWLRDVYFKAVRISVVPDGSCSSDEFCSLTQGAYGNRGGEFCNGQSQKEVMDELLLSNGGMTLGIPDNGRTFTIPEDGGQCIENILPGGGPPAVLSDDLGCDNFGSLLKNGRLKNSLLAQAITTQLNLWLSPSLGNLVLEDRNFYTVASSGCGDESIDTPKDDTLYFSIPSSVYNYLNDKTVNEIFALANKALGTYPWPSNKPSLNDINKALTVINEVFDGCRFIYFPSDYKSVMAVEPDIDKSIELTIAPNPFRTSTDISFSVSNDGIVNVEIYDLSGRLVKKLFEGNMLSGENKTLRYSMETSDNQSPRICVIRTNNNTKHQIMLNLH